MSLPILKSQWHSIAFRTIATILSIDVHSSYYPGHRLALILYSAALKNPLQEAKPNNIQLLKTKKIHFISHAYFLSVCCAHLYSSPLHVGLPRWLSGKKKKKKDPPVNAGNARDMSSILGSGRSPGGGNGNPIQGSCLENSIDRGAWWITVHGVTKSWTRLSDWAHTHIFMLCVSTQMANVPFFCACSTFPLACNAYLHSVL